MEGSSIAANSEVDPGRISKIVTDQSQRRLYRFTAMQGDIGGHEGAALKWETAPPFVKHVKKPLRPPCLEDLDIPFCSIHANSLPIPDQRGGIFYSDHRW